MRWSRYYLHTTREVPSDAEVVSHQLMIRSGMLKKQAAGIYTYMPFGWRSLRKLEAIVRRELDRKGACELSMPTIQPAELWQQSGRWQVYGKELLRMKDRHERHFCYAPTAEEVVTSIVRHDVRSYKQLPLNLYQIQTKFRDEIRPRFGLLRGREFLMKDAYSFHAGEESLDETYKDMHEAYCRIFEACDLDYKVVEADTGTIGGSWSHEFMVLARTGESDVVGCRCGYAANTEKAEIGTLPVPPGLGGEGEPMEEVATPEMRTVGEVAEFLGVSESQMLKTLIYTSEKEELVAVMIRGDREVNEIKLAKAMDALYPVLATDAEVERVTGAPVGFAGPVGLAGLRSLVDRSAAALKGFVCGANKADAHLKGVRWGRDAAAVVGRASGATCEELDVLLADGGDPCPRCGELMEKTRGIEVGHIFKLGAKYSEAMGCNYLDPNGKSHPMPMGCYGLGIGRTVAAAIEQSHDEDGIVWPRPLAPFEVLLIALNPQDPEVVEQAERLYAEMTDRGLDVLYDDRKERPGVKFKDADLIGVPLRVVVGKKGLAEGKIEISTRRDREKDQVAIGDVMGRVLAWAQATAHKASGDAG